MQNADPPIAAGAPLPFDLEAEGPRMVGSRVRYPEQLGVYAARYDHAERTIKRWVDAGKRATPIDIPPLHRPADMPAWWERHMRIECPAGVLNAAKVGGVTARPPAAASAVTVDEVVVESLDFEGNVRELRRALATDLQRLRTAEKAEPPDENLVTARRRAYGATFEILRKAEDALTAWLKERGDLVPRDEVRAENNRIASSIYGGVMRLLKTVRPQLAGKLPPEEDRIWQVEVQACFTALKGARFTALSLDEIPH